MGKSTLLPSSKCDADCRRALEQLARLREDVAYFDRHHAKLRKSYPNRWVAIGGRRVLGRDRSLSNLRRKLLARGIDPGATLVQFLADPPHVYVLPGQQDR